MVETMDELIAQVRGQLYRLQDLQEATSGIRVSETSPDGSVTAVVDGAGALVDLAFSDAIRSMSPAEFERVLTATAQAALARAYAERGELITAFNSGA
ncbi:YbaB/EbfC family nucleoid-associated protein [Nocardia camponoti]|uniref:YbaB/EbfC family DNA-binding protein n=1 Tax=Nocardia camponoti TaxID=1616106 RepID=A0A917QLU6_9NOCA|nr:YbaB/EbfC family nucleoid-associated protein [Nocardia camponoti]GGK57537.1 hypothetical protein GCM10011591_32110 [Nocardia camponoti]